MRNYQAHLFDQIEGALDSIEGVEMVVQYNFSNVGTLILMRGLSTIDSWAFDIQRSRVHILHGNHQLGPRSEHVFWWNPTDSGDNDEVHRFLEAVVDAASSHVRSTTT